jgi:dTDP-4-amino-4,6-dideoxygalactose transaminase
VIEDAAQAVLAEYQGQRVGSFGWAGCFSLHPLKNLNACGDGGVIVTNNPDLYDQLKVLRNIGLKSRDDCVTWSHNSRLDTVQAAMLLVKLNYGPGSFPVVERQAQQILSLPIYQGLTPAEIERVCDTIRAFYAGG